MNEESHFFIETCHRARDLGLLSGILQVIKALITILGMAVRWSKGRSKG